MEEDSSHVFSKLLLILYIKTLHKNNNTYDKIPKKIFPLRKNEKFFNFVLKKCWYTEKDIHSIKIRILFANSRAQTQYKTIFIATFENNFRFLPMRRRGNFLGFRLTYANRKRFSNCGNVV